MARLTRAVALALALQASPCALPAPADRPNPWSWRAPEQLRLAREALRRGAGLPACGEM